MPPDDSIAVVIKCEKVFADPSHEEHDKLREWLGPDEGDVWDPHAFDLDAINRHLAAMR